MTLIYSGKIFIGLLGEIFFLLSGIGQSLKKKSIISLTSKVFSGLKIQ